MRPLVRPLVLLLLLGSAACGSSRSGGPQSQLRTTVRVENRSLLDMNIYVLRGGQRVRLGDVPGLSTRVLTIPENLVFGISSLRFLAYPAGSRRTPMAQEIQVMPGDEIVLEIMP